MAEVLPVAQIVSLIQGVSNDALVGITVPDLNDVTTWRPVYKPTANSFEIQAAQAILATYNSNIEKGDANTKALLPNLFVIDRSANFTFVVPAGHAIRSIYIKETAGAAITGGLRIGTTNGGNDVLAAFAVAGNSIPIVRDAVLNKRAFSLVADQTLFVQAVTSWNGAHLTGRVFLDRLIA